MSINREDPLSELFRPRTSWTGALLGIIAVCLLIGVGLYVYTTVSDRSAIRRAANTEMTITASEAAASSQIEKAIREQKLITGMTPQEVIMARGTPSSIRHDGRILDACRSGGGVEIWEYPSRTDGIDAIDWVVFNSSGTAMITSDIVRQRRALSSK